MAKQALDTIKEAEKRSLELVEKAHADAAQMMVDANKKAEDDIEAHAEQNRQELIRQKEKAVEKAQEEQKTFVSETESVCRELEQKLMSRQGAAVEALIKAIAEK